MICPDARNSKEAPVAGKITATTSKGSSINRLLVRVRTTLVP